MNYGANLRYIFSEKKLDKIMNIADDYLLY